MAIWLELLLLKAPAKGLMCVTLPAGALASVNRENSRGRDYELKNRTSRHMIWARNLARINLALVV